MQSVLPVMWTSGNVSVITTYGDMEYWLDLNDYMEYMPNWEWWMANKSHLHSGRERHHRHVHHSHGHLRG